MPSSVIRHIDYEKDKQRLTIKFVSGLVYYYYSVPAEIFLQFISSKSKGIYFNEYIKDNYPYERVTE